MGARKYSAPRGGNLRAHVPSPFDLTGRVALVTGAGRGLGAAIADTLAEAGADLILWGRSVSRLERRAASLRTSSNRMLTQRVDVTRPAQVKRALATALRRFRHIDILVNNAGIWDGDPAVSLSLRQWDRVFATDLRSLFFVSQAVAPSMMRQGYGKIINLASTAGILAVPHGAAYATAKAGVMHLTRVLAVEWGPFGVRVTGIAPGVFRTDMTRDMFEDRAWARTRQAALPLRRFGEPEDIKGLALFLASPASDHLTGQTIIIDGGASLTV